MANPSIKDFMSGYTQGSGQENSGSALSDFMTGYTPNQNTSIIRPVETPQPTTPQTAPEEPFQLRMAKQQAAENEIRRRVQEMVGGLAESSVKDTQQKRANQAAADKEYRNSVWDFLNTMISNAGAGGAGVVAAPMDAAEAHGNLQEAKQASDEAAAAFDKQNILERQGHELSGWGQRTVGNLGNTLLTLGDAYNQADARMQAYDPNNLLISQMLGQDPVKEAERQVEARTGEEARAALDKAYSSMDRIAERGNEELQRAKDGASALGRLGLDLETGALDLGADAAANFVAPGAGMVAMGARVFGEAAREERQKGGDLGQQMLAGTKAAAIEVLTEKISGPFEKIYGKSFAGKAINKAIDAIDSKGGRAAIKLLSDALGEGAEEVLSDLLNPTADYLLGLSDSWDEAWSDTTAESVLYDGLLGTLLGAAGSAGNIIRTKGTITPADIQQIKADAQAAGENAVQEAAQQAAPAVEGNPAQSAEIEREASGDIPAPPATENADTGESERLNLASVAEETAAVETPKQSRKEKSLWSAPKDNNGWKRYYNGVIPIADALDVVAPAYTDAMDAEAESGEAHTPLTNAYVAAWEDVRQGTISPMAAATLISEAYQSGGAEAVDRLYRPGTGNLTKEALARAKEIDAVHAKEKNSAKRKPAVEAPQAEAAQAAPEQTAMQPTTAAEPTTAAAEIAPVEQTVSERPAPEVQNSTSEAADTTGRDYEQAGKQYGIIPPGEKAARESNVPNRMDDATAVGKTARTLYEAGATPENRLKDIRNAVVDGKFDSVPVSNDELTNRATKKIEQQGWQASLAEFMSDVRGGRRNESVVALGAVLLNNAANSDMSGEQYAELVAAYHQSVHDPARALAAARIMKTLTPEARLYAITKQVQTMSDELVDRSARRQRNKPNAKQVADEVNATKKRTIEKVAEEWSEFKFADEAAKRVADSIKNQIKNSFTPKTKNALDTFVGYVKKFASEKIDLKRNANKPMTATELLAEIAQNEDLFREVYEKAQAQFADENSTGYREFVSDYLNEPVNLSGAEGQRGRLFARAIAESAVATGENVNYIRNQSALGITNGVIAERIASNLIRQTGAQGELADSIRQAANRYVESAVNGDASNNRTERLVSGMMKNLAARFSEIASQDSATKESIAQDLADQLAIEYGLDPGSAKAVAENATEEYNRQLSEAMEKEVARRFAPKDATERQRKEFAQQLSEAINLGAFDSEYAQQATDKLFGIDGGIKLDPALIEKYLAQDTEQGRDDVIDEMMQNVADQMPSTLMDKWTALRYVNMLGNFKTQSRNLIGNVLMGVNTAVKSRVGAAIEAAAQATGAYKGERTKSVWAGHKLYGEAWNDYRNVKDAAEGEGKYQDNNRNLSRAIQDKRTIFKNNGKWGTNEAKTAVGRSAPVKAARKVSDVVNKGLEGYRKSTNWAMTEGDNIFLRFTYMDALGGYLAANKVKSISDASPELLERARAYAIKQAQEATFHDSNGLSEWASSFDRGWDKTTAGKVAKTVTQGVLPFRKTPANVLVRAEEYSPVGVLNTLVKAVQAAEGKPDVSGADVIESLSKTLTGSSLTVLGYLLGMAGKARAKGSDDDKLKKLEAEEGKQDYSVTLGDGSSLSLEWAAPSSIPFFMGARLAEITDGESPYTILTLLGGVTDPVLQMSMLSGLNDALNNLDKYNGDIEAVPSFMLNSLFSYLTQGMTNSLIGQAEQASEEYRRSTYTDKESPLSSSLQYALSRAGAKIPGVDYHQQDYYDAWGRKVESGTTGERIMSAFFSPAYKKEDRTTEVDDELARLYKETGENVLGTEHKPKRGDKINGEVLSPEEFEQYSVTRGELAYDMIDGFIKSDEYKNLSDADRAEIILNLYQFAADQGKKEIARDRGEEYANTDWNKVEALAQEDEDEAVNYLSVRTVAKNAIQGKDYDVLDQLLGDGGAYHNLGDDAQDMLFGSIDGLKRLVSMRGDGVSAENAMKAIDAIKGLKTQDEQTAAIVGLDGMSDTDKIKALKSCTSEGYAEKVQAAYDSGVSLEEWSRVYAAQQRIKNGEGTAQNKATDFAAWLDKNTKLTASQKDIVQEQLSFFSMNKAEPTHYDGLRESKVNEDTARRIANTMTRIQPLEGKTQATQEQKVDTILGMGMSDGDTWAALKEYTSESYYSKAAEAYRRGIDLQDFVRGYSEADTSGGNGLSQTELFDYYKANPNNETFVKVMWLIGGFKTDWDTYKRKHR